MVFYSDGCSITVGIILHDDYSCISNTLYGMDMDNCDVLKPTLDGKVMPIFGDVIRTVKVRRCGNKKGTIVCFVLFPFPFFLCVCLLCSCVRVSFACFYVLKLALLRINLQNIMGFFVYPFFTQK